VNDPDAAKILGNNRGVPVSASGRAALKESVSATDKIIYDYLDLVSKDQSVKATYNIPGFNEYSKLLSTVSQEIAFSKTTIDKACGLHRTARQILPRTCLSRRAVALRRGTAFNGAGSRLLGGIEATANLAATSSSRLALGFFGLASVPSSARSTFDDPYNLLTPPRWIGLENFITMFSSDRSFAHSLTITFQYVLASVPLRLAFALLIAMILNRGMRGIGIHRTVYYIPSLLGEAWRSPRSGSRSSGPGVVQPFSRFPRH
jgi:hypothetical protein